MYWLVNLRQKRILCTSKMQGEILYSLATLALLFFQANENH